VPLLRAFGHHERGDPAAERRGGRGGEVIPAEEAIARATGTDREAGRAMPVGGRIEGGNLLRANLLKNQGQLSNPGPYLTSRSRSPQP